MKNQINLTTCCRLLYIFSLLTSFILVPLSNAAGGAVGQWQLLQPSIGVSAMHMQLLHTDHVIIFDRTDFGKSNLSLPDGKCRTDLNDTALKLDCTAHSVEYHVASNAFRPLTVQTDVWCSSGAVNADGTLIQTGGFNDGERRVRTFSPCGTAACDWQEIELGLAARRWYATNHILPGGREQIVIGGRRQFNYEFYPKTASSAKNLYSLPFLVQTNDPKIENNLYPFVFLNVDGNLFIFANNRAILFDYGKNRVVKTYPVIPGGDPRSYPSTGSAVLLPLKDIESAAIEAEVLICGGAPKGAYAQALNGRFVEALKTCARIKITDPNPDWTVEEMPQARVMGDMTLLPNGDVLIVNGGASGTAGWELGREPVLSPVVYRPGNKPGSRFETQSPSEIPRMYHSTAVLLRDGRVLVGGSNPHIYYNFTGVIFPTELSLEAFSPKYMGSEFDAVRPRIVSPETRGRVSYGEKVVVRISVTEGVLAGDNTVSFSVVFPSFTTHSFSMNQRLLVLAAERVTSVGKSIYEVETTSPSSAVLAPAGYYLLFVVHREIPSEGIWVQITN